MKVAFAFFTIYAVLQAASWGLAYRGYLDPMIEMTAEVTGALSNVTGVPATVIGNQVFLASRVLRIDLDCTGLSILLVYSALVLAYPLSVRTRLLSLAVGVPTLIVANVIRLLAVAQLSGPLEDRAFFFAHDYLFKVYMVAVVIALWAFYLSRARRNA